MEVLQGRALEEAAYQIANEAHSAQMYNFGPYVAHPGEVALLAKKLGYPSEVVACGFLHDTIEDTSVTPDLLVQRGIPMVVVEGVVAVSFTEADRAAGVDKIEKARSHPMGHVTKFCDSSRNFATTATNPEILEMEETGKAMRFALRYTGYLSRLRENLPQPEDIRQFLADVV